MSCINLTFLQNKAVCSSVLLNNVKRASEFTQILDGCSDGGGGGGVNVIGEISVRRLFEDLRYAYQSLLILLQSLGFFGFFNSN